MNLAPRLPPAIIGGGAPRSRVQSRFYLNFGLDSIEPIEPGVDIWRMHTDAEILHFSNQTVHDACLCGQREQRLGVSTGSVEDRLLTQTVTASRYFERYGLNWRVS